jgi:hypothetical protein
MPTYQAKKNGNRYQHYSRALGAQASWRLSLDREMRWALARDERVDG